MGQKNFCVKKIVLFVLWPFRLLDLSSVFTMCWTFRPLDLAYFVPSVFCTKHPLYQVPFGPSVFCTMCLVPSVFGPSVFGPTVLEPIPYHTILCNTIPHSTASGFLCVVTWPEEIKETQDCKKNAFFGKQIRFLEKKSVFWKNKSTNYCRSKFSRV